MTGLKLLLAGLVAATAATLAPSPAAAVCDPLLYELTGRCSPCSFIGGPYALANEATGGQFMPTLTCAA